jgi:hypothetical protein
MYVLYIPPRIHVKRHFTEGGPVMFVLIRAAEVLEGNVVVGMTLRNRCP